MSRFGECNFSFLKNSQVQINVELNKKNCMITYRIRENFFQSFHTKFFVITLHEIIGLQNFSCLSANHNPELWCVICTGVTLFAPVLSFLHWCYTWTALLSANQNRAIFSCVLLVQKYWFTKCMLLMISITVSSFLKKSPKHIILWNVT